MGRATTSEWFQSLPNDDRKSLLSQLHYFRQAIIKKPYPELYDQLIIHLENDHHEIKHEKGGK